MIWDVLNAVIATGVGVFHSMYSLLPQSPLYLDSATQAALTPLLANVGWWLPVSLMLTTFALWVAGVLTIAGALLIKQFVEAVIP